MIAGPAIYHETVVELFAAGPVRCFYMRMLCLSVKCPPIRTRSFYQNEIWIVF